MIAKGGSSMSGPVGGKECACVGRGSGSTWAGKEGWVMLNRTPGHGLCGIGLKSMTDATDVLNGNVFSSNGQLYKSSKEKKT